MDSATISLNLTSEDLATFDRLRIPHGLLALAGIRRVTDEEARDHYGITGNGDMSGIVFEYRDPTGARRWTDRVRRDHPEIENGRPVRKYVAPYGDVRHVFFPPGSDVRLESPRTAIILVEAEKSSLAIMAWAARVDTQLLAIAMGGCYGFRGRRGKTTDASGTRVDEVGVLADMSVCVGRTVYVLLDANVGSNDAVMKARRKLVRELQKLGTGVVRVVDLPVEPGINGPDDYLAVHSDEEFTALLLAQPTEAGPDNRPAVAINAGKNFDAVDRAEKILLEHAVELGIFQRNAELVRIVTIPQTRKESGLRLPAGTILIQPVSRVALREAFDRLIRFERLDEKGNPYPVDCPSKVAESYLARTGSQHVPILTGTIFAPVIRDDGTILATPGYDPSTGLYFISTEEWLPVPDEPTTDDVQDALCILAQPFAEFPWCNKEDWSTHVAGIFTAIQRRLLPTAPLFSYRAPERRSGKSKLAESLAIIATGRPAPATATSGDAEEFRKAITAALYQGYPIINLDNVDGVLASPFLSMALTQQTYSDRILGETRMVQLGTRALWTATGNNLSFKGDLVVRVLQCSIDAKVEHPEERVFQIPDLDRFLLEHRPQLVHAVLTILRAYHVAGQPSQKGIKAWGGFDVWSNTIRQAIVWAGLTDPAETRKRIIENDPERESAATLLHVLHDTFIDAFTVKDAIYAPNETLKHALTAVAGRKGEIDPRSLGGWCRRWQDRVIDNLRLTKAGEEHHSAKWKVEFLAPQNTADAEE